MAIASQTNRLNLIWKPSLAGILGFVYFCMAVPFTAQGQTESDVARKPAPNIVFAFADDLGRYASAYSDPKRPSVNDVIQTPNFDRIAKEGTIFDCALVSSPSCTPSRAAIVACRHFFRNGSHSQLHSPWVKGHPDPWDDVRGFPLMLQEKGYHIGWTYKMHISPDRMGGTKRNYQKAGRKFNSFSQTASKWIGEKEPTESTIDNAKKQLLSEVRGNFGAFLADRKKDQPFYYWFNPTNTHRAWTKGSGKKLWGIEPDQLKGKMPKFLPDNPTIREDFADYLGEALAFDASVGVLIDELVKLGEFENTIFVVSGDHGAPGFPRGKCNLYDFGTQVPLAIRWPKKIAAGRKIFSTVSLFDLGPTFLEAAGIEKAKDMDGSSLLSAMDPKTKKPESKLRGNAFVGRETHVDEARAGGLPYPMRAIRTKDFLYIINFAPERYPVATLPLSAELLKSKRKGSRRMDIDFGPTRTFFEEHETDPKFATEFQLGFGLRAADELYAVGEDPDQMKNLSGDRQFAEIREKLRRELLSELRKGNDPRVAGDGTAFDKPPYAPLDKSRGVLKK